MAKKGFFEKVLNFVGIEQEVVDDEEGELVEVEEDESDRRSSRGGRFRRGSGGPYGTADSDPTPVYGPSQPNQYGPGAGSSQSGRSGASSLPSGSLQSKNGQVRTRPQVVPLNHAAAGRQLRVLVVEPRSFDEVQSIADSLRSGQAVVVNVEETDREIARRLMDFLAGALYVLGGTVQRIGGNIFMAAPSGVDIAVDLRAEVAAASDLLHE